MTRRLMFFAYGLAAYLIVSVLAPELFAVDSQSHAHHGSSQRDVRRFSGQTP